HKLLKSRSRKAGEGSLLQRETASQKNLPLTFFSRPKPSRSDRDPSSALRDREFSLLLDRAQVLQILLRRLQMGAQLLFLFDRSRMNAAPAAAQLHGVPQVEHRMVDQILQRVLRARSAVKNATHHDGVVRGIVVSQAASGIVCAPGHLGPSHESVKEAAIQVFKNLVQTVVLPLRDVDAFAATGLADQVGLGRYRPAPRELTMAGCKSGIDRLAI